MLVFEVLRYPDFTAVTVTVIRFAPTFSAHTDGVPAQPPYATVAFAWLFVPVIVTLLTVFATPAA